jgi:hypothetical protein
MSLIAKILSAREPLFDHALHQLEQISGRPGMDVKLAAEIAEKSARATRQMGADPAAATGAQLYDALIGRAHEHDTYLARSIGGRDTTLISEMLPLIIKAAAAAPLPKDGWFLREDRARDFLRATPPTAIMARLGYTEVDKLLAAEDIYELMLALRFVETPEWLAAFNNLYTSLTPSDFETRTIHVVPFSPAKWGDIAVHFIAKKRHNITHSKEMGAIAIMPLQEERMKGITLKILPLIIHYYNEIRLYSSYFKLMRSKRDFGRVLADTINADLPKVSLVDRGQINWRVIQRYYGKLPGENHPEVFQPHLQPEDLHWRRAEEVLYEIAPPLKFWDGLDYVAVIKDGDLVSFNLMDVSLSYSNEITYADRYIYHLREALWNEVFARYMGERTLEHELLTQLDNALVKPKELARG